MNSLSLAVLDAVCPGDVAEAAHERPPARRDRCPWCGEWVNLDAVLYGSTEDLFPTFRVICQDCGGAGPIAPTPKMAWGRWNRRRAELI